MPATTTAVGSAERWGPVWGARASDWAASEEQQLPTYEVAMHEVGLEAGSQVLEVGCGSGVFLRAAADRGAHVSGIDASEALVSLARQRVPSADVRTGEMQSLPYDDDTFDVVAGFNSFFFAADMVAALAEARRVAKPGAPVVIQVWGRPENCDLTAMKLAVGALVPTPDPDVPAPPALSEPGVLEGIAAAAGLSPIRAFDISWAFEIPDEETLARLMVAPGIIVELVGLVGEERVRDAIVDGLARYRTDQGGYRLENEWHFLIASA